MDNLLNEYKNTVKKEALIKSLIIGLISGFIVMAIISIISLLTKTNLIIITLLIGCIVITATTITLTKTLYKTSLKVLATRVDSLGLEERLITMLEYQDDNSIMAELQRNDTKEVLKTIEPSKLKVSLVKWPIIACVVLFIVTCNLTVGSTILAVKEDVNGNITEEQELIDPHKEKIDELIQEIRDIIDYSDLEGWKYNYLHAIVDDMVVDLDKYDLLDFNSKSERIIETKELILELLVSLDEQEEEEEEDSDFESDSS